jgi:hypothetical protein
LKQIPSRKGSKNEAFFRPVDTFGTEE